MSKPWPQTLFDESAEQVARALIGVTLLVDGVGGPIVETEAYDVHDPASHSFGGIRARNAPMFGPVGCAYVYRIYGLHWCFNIVCDARQPGSAVLIRAIEPRHGLERMTARRGPLAHRALCSGPGKLCSALSIDGKLNGRPIGTAPFRLIAPDGRFEIVQDRRIGITQAADTLWRFGMARSPFVSKPFRQTL